MSFKTKYLRLTKEQKERGVIFSSVLIGVGDYELHEVMSNDPNKYEHIANLKDVSFFKSMAKDFGWNVVHEIRQ